MDMAGLEFGGLGTRLTMRSKGACYYDMPALLRADGSDCEVVPA